MWINIWYHFIKEKLFQLDFHMIPVEDVILFSIFEEKQLQLEFVAQSEVKRTPVPVPFLIILSHMVSWSPI